MGALTSPRAIAAKPPSSDNFLCVCFDMTEETPAPAELSSEPTAPSTPTAAKRFNPIVALQGGHRPSRVVLHGVGYLIGFPAVLIGLAASGAIRAIVGALRQSGLSSGVVAMFPTLLVLAYLLLWTWFLMSLFNCARNAETESGMKAIRSASTGLGLVSAAAAVVLTAISLVR